MPCLGLTSFLLEGAYGTCQFLSLCQCPVSGLPHFYVHRGYVDIKKIFGVNALCRAYLISTGNSGIRYNLQPGCVNALCRAYLISTLSSPVCIYIQPIWCQCPVSGLPHFYNMDSFVADLQKKCMCQCPVSGLPHFYPARGLTCEKGKFMTVSMPCVGLTSFLQIYRMAALSLTQLCQCPVSGLPHFYDETEFMNDNRTDDVSMPCVGLTSFLPCPSESQCLCGFQRLFLQVFFRIF